jgi:hypothetical protein
MLRCAIKRLRHQGNDWHDTLALAVAWNHEGILRLIISQLRTSDPETPLALEAAFHEAFLGNKMSLCQIFMEYTNCTLAYSVERQDVPWKDSVVRAFQRTLGKKRDQDMFAPVLVNWTRLVNKLLSASGKNPSTGLKRFNDLYETAMTNEEFRKVVVRSGANKSKSTRGIFGLFGAEESMKGASDSGQESRLAGRQAIEAYERVLKFVLGETFWYQAGCIGCDFDLFLWALLMLRHDMAMLIWSKFPDSPVRSALLAATLYRRWAEMPDVEPHIASKMLESATVFENVAVEVQLLAMKDDTKNALETLEIPSRLWKGQTGVDLAIFGECSTFIERCCVQALDLRWSGDIHPYNQTIGLYPSVIVCVLSGGLLAPSFIEFRDPPTAEVLRPPGQIMPISQGYRSTKNSNGTNIDQVVTSETLFNNLQKAMSDGVKCISDDHMLELSDEQFRGLVTSKEFHHANELSWYVKRNLFFLCPVTIFVMDAILQVSQNIVLMVFLLHCDNFRTQITWIEWTLAAMQTSNTICEVVQLLVDGWRTYFGSRWNWMRTMSFIFFWMGFLEILNQPSTDIRGTGCGVESGKSLVDTFRSHPSNRSLWSMFMVTSDQVTNCNTTRDRREKQNLEKPREVGFADSYYAGALFFMWLRVLRLMSVNKNLGPLVIVMGRMGRDMCVFAAIWGVLLVAFSTALAGANDTGLTSPVDLLCADSSDEVDAARLAGGFMRIRCWSSWWIVRTYYQAFGQPFFEDLTTDGSNMLAMLMWPIMNLMLVNLLIAIMNDTYADVKHHSKLEWMVEMLHLAKEYRSASRLNVMMLFYDIVMFMIRKKEIDARLANLSLYGHPTKSEGRLSSKGHTSQTIGTWIDDCRFKFKKWQHKDIPSQPVTDQRIEIEGLLQELENVQENKLITANVTNSIWKKFTVQVGITKMFRSASQTDAHKSSNRTNRRTSMSSILSSVQAERKAILKRKRALLIRQQKIDMEETRRCTEFLMRAKTIYLKQRFENARKDVKDERQTLLLRRAKASAEAQLSGRTPELNPMAAPPDTARFGSHSSFTGLGPTSSSGLERFASKFAPK